MFEPRMTRMGTDEAEPGDAWASQAALPNHTLWQASLPERLSLNRPLASRAALLWPSTLSARH
jgi:hypothetical protein